MPILGQTVRLLREAGRGNRGLTPDMPHLAHSRARPEDVAERARARSTCPDFTRHYRPA